MRPVNLIPPEERRGEKAPLRTGPLAYVIVAVLAVALLGVTLVVTTDNRISDREAEKASLEAQVSQAQAEAERYRSFADFAALQQARQETVMSLATSRFDWERVLRELAIVIPDDVSLTAMTASASADSASSSTSVTTSSGVEGIEGPSLDLHGCASGHETVASFLSALRDVDGVTRVAVLSSDRPDTTSAAGAPTSDGGGTTSGSCAGDSVSTFEIVAAFDSAQPDAAATPGSTTQPATATTADQSEISDAQQQLQQQTDSATQATEQGQDAVNTFVPGIGSAP